CRTRTATRQARSRPRPRTRRAARRARRQAGSRPRLERAFGTLRPADDAARPLATVRTRQAREEVVRPARVVRLELVERREEVLGRASLLPHVLEQRLDLAVVAEEQLHEERVPRGVRFGDGLGEPFAQRA